MISVNLMIQELFNGVMMMVMDYLIVVIILGGNVVFVVDVFQPNMVLMQVKKNVIEKQDVVMHFMNLIWHGLVFQDKLI